LIPSLFTDDCVSEREFSCSVWSSCLSLTTGSCTDDWIGSGSIWSSVCSKDLSLTTGLDIESERLFSTACSESSSSSGSCISSGWILSDVIQSLIDSSSTPGRMFSD
jgi:hypothetical protein